MGCVPPVLYRTGRDSLSKEGLCPGVVSVQGDLCPENFCPGVLCPLGSLSRGSLSTGVSVQGVSFQGVSVQGFSVQGGLCPRGPLSGRPLPPPRGQTNTCEIINLPNTSFAGCNNYRWNKDVSSSLRKV